MLLNCVVLEKTLESPFGCKEIKPDNPKGNESWIFIGRTDAEPEAPILWPPGEKSWLIWKDPDAGKDWRQEEKGVTEDKMAGWHHWFQGQEFEQPLGGRWWIGRPGMLHTVLGICIEKRSISCRISRQESHSFQWLQPCNVSRLALRELRKEKNTYHLASIKLQSLPMVSPEEVEMRILAADSWGSYQRMISVNPDSCIFP